MAKLNGPGPGVNLPNPLRLFLARALLTRVPHGMAPPEPIVALVKRHPAHARDLTSTEITAQSGLDHTPTLGGCVAER